jgi:hypothetical protein
MKLIASLSFARSRDRNNRYLKPVPTVNPSKNPSKLDLVFLGELENIVKTQDSPETAKRGFS